MKNLLDAFISYGRADSKAFAAKLHDRLLKEGLKVWFDQNDIPLGVDYQNQIDDGIEKAHNFLFIIAPHSINSPYCLKEIELAIKRNKRIIPLLHVMQISQETWQQRNPFGKPEDWEAYKAKGLHESYQNMHPTIRKLNWVYFQEGVNDFEESLAGLLEILERQKTYVYQHTYFLAKALEWKRNQKQSRYLLIGEEWQQAQAWLKVQFKDEQPPCFPTEEHCEFITESIKNANNLMTQVFLCHAELDTVVTEKIRRTLMREGFTVWTNRTDIKTGTEFQETINRGIEAADNLVYLISPNSLRSQYCQQEIAYATRLNKHIIPLLISATDLDDIPPEQRSLQFIDFTEYDDENKYRTAADKLLNVLKEDTHYYEWHKLLLVKALKWERLDQPKTMLLSGSEFAIAQNWLQQSEQHQKQTSATSLHKAYIAASQEMNQFFDVFISYGRADSLAFAIKVHARLIEQGFKVWFDKEDIPLGVDYQKQIDDGIEKAHNFLYIIAPHSINSPYCRKEIDLALKRNKRIIPLLHIEQINQETWEQRNPFGKPEDWEAYKAKGLHTSFQNMHPEISKINWVYFREGMDDFEASLAGLLKLCKQQQEYVKQHSYFLAKALEWERYQKQSRYLLIGDERKQAEAWLKIRFKEEQPPCVPTDLHCELITESIKNGNNLMTQVFLAHAEADAVVMDQIRKSLRRECFTVWTNKTDIQTGEAFEDAIERGIEQADNVVYLLSPDSLKSEYCQQELEYALSLNKRIIPILVRETPSDQVPPALRNLQYIDLTDNVQEADYSLDESQLLKILRQDAAYYNEHKMLLTKALKWERQHRNPSILLRGYNLHSAEAWLKVAKSRKQHLPTALQEEFIAESLRQPAAVSLDVFVSYSRTDSDFARKLNDELQIQGKTTWFDQESIASGADFQQEIYRGIESSNNFLFILSPRSVNSPYCAGEVEYAAKLNKRFVTVLYRQVNPADLHPELAKVQWIDFNQNQRDFNANFSRLLRTLDTDREYVNSHTKWSQRALEWQEKGKSKDLLLRGNELAIAENWVQEAEQNNKKPAITDLQKDYIRHSQQARDAGVKQEKQRVVMLWSLLGLMSVAFVAAVVVSVFAWNERNRANNERNRAEKSLGEQVDALSRYSKTLSASNQEFDALIEGIRAGKPLLQQRNTPPESKKPVEDVLRRALHSVNERDRIEGKTTISVSPDNKTFATLNEDGTVTLWNFQGQALPTPLRHDREEITSIFFSDKDSKTIATLSKKTVKLWNKDGKERGTLPLQKEVWSVIVSSDGNKIATYSWDEENYTVKLWNVETQQPTPLLPKEKFNDIDFSSDGKLIVTLSGDGDNQIIQLWSSQGKLIKRFPTKQKFDYLEFSPDDKLILTSGWDEGNQRTVKLWNVETQQPTPFLPKEKFNYVSFSSDGKLIVTQSGNKDNQIIQLWSSQGKPIKRLPTKQKFDSIYFSPDDKLIVTSPWDNDNYTVKFWKFETQQPASLLPDEKFKDFSFRPDGKQIATLSGEGDNQIVKLWNKNGEELQTLHLNTLVDNIYFNSEGNTIATVSPDSTIKLWTINNSDRQILTGHDASVYRVAFSPKDGKLIVTLSGDRNTGMVKLWRHEGEKIKPFNPFPTNEQFNYLYFSPDSKLIATYRGGGDKQTVKLWRREGEKIKPFNPFPANEKFNDVSFREDGKLIATYSGKEKNKTVKLWSREGKELASFPPKEKFYRIEFSPDNKLIAAYSWEGDNRTAKLWRIEGKQLQLLLSNEKFDSVSFSEDGKLIATYSEKEDNKTAKLWRIEGKQLQSLLANEKYNNVRFSKDGKLIATFPKVSDTKVSETKGSDSKKVNSGSSDDQPVKLRSREGKELAAFPPNDKFDDLEFSPDGKLIATFNQNNGTFKFWKLAEQKLQPLQEGKFNTYESSPDSKLIATANNNNNTVQIWNQEGKELAHLNLNNSIQSLSFSPDGKILAIASNDKTAIMWYMKRDDWEKLSRTELKELVKKACGVVGNYLKRKPKDNSERILCPDIGKK